MIRAKIGIFNYCPKVDRKAGIFYDELSISLFIFCEKDQLNANN
jgi:hypothetical protein